MASSQQLSLDHLPCDNTQRILKMNRHKQYKFVRWKNIWKHPWIYVRLLRYRHKSSTLVRVQCISRAPGPRADNNLSGIPLRREECSVVWRILIKADYAKSWGHGLTLNLVTGCDNIYRGISVTWECHASRVTCVTGGSHTLGCVTPHVSCDHHYKHIGRGDQTLSSLTSWWLLYFWALIVIYNCNTHSIFLQVLLIWHILVFYTSLL